MDKVKRFLGIKKDKKGTPAAGGGAQAAPLAINIEDLSGSKKASHGAPGAEASHKAQGGHRHHHHHHAHDAFQSKSASKGKGSGLGSTKTVGDDLASMGSMAASDIVGAQADKSSVGKSGAATDQAWRQEPQIPSAKPEKRSEVAAKSGFVNPDGTRLTKDDVNMMKVMLTQVLESYIKQIETLYSDQNLHDEMNLKNTKFYKSFCDENNQLVNVDKIPKKDLADLRDYETRVKQALIDAEEKPKLLNNIRIKLSRLSGEMDAIQKGKEPVLASAFLEDYMRDPLNYTGPVTQKSQMLLGKVVSTKGVSDFTRTMNAASAEFEEHKDEVLEGIGDVKKYNPKKSKKLAGGRMQGSSTLLNEVRKLFYSSAKFRDAINADDFIVSKNGNQKFGDQDAEKLKSLMFLPDDDNVTADIQSIDEVANRVLAIIQKNKLSSSVGSVENFSKAAGVASKHAQKLKSKSAITFSDLMQAYMDINAGVGDQASKGSKSVDGKLKAQWAGTGSGTIVGASGDTISAELFMLFNFAANAMNEIKAIQKKQPDVAKSRAVKLAGIVNSMTVSAHTFVNGNGRTCRLLADVILESVELPPASINNEITGVGGLFGELYANDGQKADGQKDFDRSTQGYLAGVKESDRLLRT